MKLVKCPFHSVGCQSTVPQRTIEQHRSENLTSHLLCILQVSHKEASPEALKQRVQELEKVASPGRLVSARDARSLTYVVKDLEAKLGPIKEMTNKKSDDESKDLIDLGEEKTNIEAKTNVADKQVGFGEVPAEKETAANAHSEGSDRGKRESMESSGDALQKNEDLVDSVPEKKKDSPSQRDH